MFDSVVVVVVEMLEEDFVAVGTDDGLNSQEQMVDFVGSTVLVVLNTRIIIREKKVLFFTLLGYFYH